MGNSAEHGQQACLPLELLPHSMARPSRAIRGTNLVTARNIVCKNGRAGSSRDKPHCSGVRRVGYFSIPSLTKTYWVFWFSSSSLAFGRGCLGDLSDLNTQRMIDARQDSGQHGVACARQTGDDGVRVAI